MIIKNKDAEIILKNEGVIGRLLYKNDKMEIVRLTIEPEKEIERHVLPFDVEFYVVDGEGIFYLGEESYSMLRDSLVKCDKGIERGWKNLSSVNLELLVVKNIYLK